MPVTIPAAGRLVFVETPGGQWGEFQEGRARVQQAVDAGAHEELALFGVAPLRLLAAALAHLGQRRAQIRGQCAVVGCILKELGALWVDLGFQDFHRVILYLRYRHRTL